ncbi:MAG: DivIVA domain-containing protein [Firmicutes bacterium]|nr:DivIVA domain-containing protein [Bacillota bacterium]
MRFSPLDIYNKEFKKSTFGYNVKQVNEFLDEVGMAYEKLLKEVNLLQDENDKIKEKLAGIDEMEKRLEKIMLTVQDTSQEQIKQAKKEADIIIKRAEIKAEQIEKEARNKVQKEYQALQDLKEHKDLFKIRFKTLLESHLEMIEEDEVTLPGSEEDIAVSRLDLDE